MINPTRACAIVALLLVGGCVSTGGRYAEAPIASAAVPANKSRLVFFRESGFVGSLASFRVQINDATVGEVPSGSALVIEYPPGPARISVDSALTIGRYAIPVTLQGGKEYFLQISPRGSAVAASAVFGIVGQALENADKGERGGVAQVELVDSTIARAKVAQLPVVQ
jgi:hypothetical protein